MDTIALAILVVVAIVVSIGGFLIVRRLRASRSYQGRLGTENGHAMKLDSPEISTAAPEASSSETLPVNDPTIGGDLVILDANGEVMLTCCEIEYMPTSQNQNEERNSVAIDRARQLATDLLTRAITLPGKTVEITFHPAVQEGLDSGVYEIIKVASGNGQRLMARAVDSKRFVGHGRFMKAGQLKKIGVSAFHIVSIAVAQAHLAEINENLEQIKEGVKDIRDFLEDKDIAQLSGTLGYLKYIVEFISRMESPDQLPIEKRTELESIRREMMIWVVQIEQEARRLSDKIKEQGDEDSWSGGTGNTFEKLKEHARASERLIRKYKLLLRTAGLLYMTSAYLDPVVFKDKDGIRILQAYEATNTLLGALQQLEEKSESLLSSAVWNRKETLEQRKQHIKQEVWLLGDQTRQEERFFADGIGRLKNKVRRIADPQGKVRITITFDNESNPEYVELV